ncbi:MAG: cupin domain-containing protein [Gemmatimonadota bacterium]
MALAPGTPQRLLDLIAIQEGSIVSRQLLKRSSGNVTLFAFDKDQELSEHTTPHDALIMVLQGRATVTVAGDGREVGTGEVTFLPGGVPHAVRAPEPFVMALVMLKAE